ncbi:integrin alpha, partial [bacterium]|nr:integrin alpha [bacterium]
MSVNIKRIITIIIMVSVVGLISLGAYMVVQKSDHRPQDSKQLSEPAIDPKAVAGGADKAWLSQAMEKIKAQEYELSKNKQGLLQAPNRKHNFRMTVHENKVGFEPRTISSEKEEKSKTKKWQWQWETDQMGRLGNMESVDKGERSVQGNMVTYDRKQMKEWYENKPEGIEQGFIIYQKPVAGSKKSSGSDPWVMIQSCRIEGLTLRLAADQNSIDFVDEHQAVIMRYGQLKVKDASDKLLPSEIRVEKNTIIVAYQDTNAKYPIVIDPLMTNPGWTAESDQANAYFGYSVASAGDVNGDGYSDVIVGAYYYDHGETDEGRAYVYHGSSSGLAGTAAWTAESDQTGAEFGRSVASAGDVNGDGYSDVIVGVYRYDNGESNEGRAYVYHGSSSGLNATANWIAESDQVDAGFGRSVASSGDVNGDGYSDVIVGAHFYNNGEQDEGRAYVYHGSSSGLENTAAWTDESDQTYAYFGYSVASAGDVNGDGYSDVIVGAYGYDNGASNEGRAYVYHGSSSGLADASAWTAESDQTGAEFGRSVASAGDVNGDGYSDVIVGAHAYDNGATDEGRVFVYHGSSSGMAGTANWTAESDQTGAEFGRSVASAGDVNGDGYSDVIVGAHYYDNGETDEGCAYVYHGSSAGLANTAAWTAESDQVDTWFGYSVASAGDVNGDGYSDVIVGAPFYDNGETNEGRVFVYHGSTSGLAATANWIVEGNEIFVGFGYSVASAGDVNGDGYSDVIVGAPFYDNGATDEGRAYVYHGSS